MKRILVVNVNWLGDVIFSSPVFAALHKQYPGARICCLTVPRVADVARQIPCVDDVMIYDEKGKDRFLLGKVRLVREIRAQNFDGAFLLHGSWTRALLVFLAGIPVRVGYNIKRRGWLLTHRVNVPQGMIHRSDHYLNVVESFCGLSTVPRTTSLRVSSEDVAAAQGQLVSLGVKEHDFVVLMHIGGNWPLKRWPIENFAKLSDALTERENTKVVICGGVSEQVLKEHILKETVRKPIIMVGHTNFSQLVGLMKSVHVVVSADSGPLHVASSVATPVVGLFGPTHPDVTGPRGGGRASILYFHVGCNIKPCYHEQCQDNICMKAISVKDVVEKIEQVRN